MLRRHLFVSSEEAFRKSQKLFPFKNMMGNNGCISIHLKVKMTILVGVLLILHNFWSFIRTL